MITRYQEKGAVELQWAENMRRLSFEGREIMNRVLNSAKAELSKEFNDALNEGRILELHTGIDDLKRLLLKHAVRELNGADAHAVVLEAA